MSTIARRAAFQATRAPFRTVSRRGYAENPAGKQADLTGDPAGTKKVNLAEGAKRDPELYVREGPCSVARQVVAMLTCKRTADYRFS